MHGLLQGRVLLREGEADLAPSGLPVRVEARGGDYGHPDLPRKVAREREVVELANPAEVGEDVVGALWYRTGEPELLERLEHEESLLVVCGREVAVVRVGHGQLRDGGALEGSGRADRQVVVHGAQRGGQILLGDRIPNPPAGYAEGLREARDGDRPLVHVADRGQAHVAVLVVHDVLVDLVGDRQDVVVFTEIRDDTEFRLREDPPGRIVGGVEQDRLRLLPEGRLQVFLCQDVAGLRGPEVDRPGSREDGRREVAFVEGLWDYHPVSRVGERHHRRRYGLGRAAGHRHPVVRVRAYPV